jgi:GT2 family glycosyltransferase
VELPSVTVVLVTYNSADVLPDCLASLDGGLAGVACERVVVVDNDSADDSAGLAARLRPTATVIRTGENGGYAKAINRGLAEVEPTGDVLVLNPDVRLRPGSVRELLAARVRSGAGIAVPRIGNSDGSTAWSLRRDPSPLRQLGEAVLGGTRAGRRPRLGEMITRPERYEQAGWVAWASGAAMLIGRACREAVGEWDESFFLYSEETDYCRRARAAGHGVRYVPEAQVTHLGGDLEVSPQLYRVLVRNKLRLFRRDHGRAATAAYRGAVVLNEASRAATGSATHRAGLRAAVRRDPGDARHPGVVIFSAQDYWYHNRAHSDVQLARGVAATRPVLLVNSIGMRMPTSNNTTDPLRRIARKLRSTAKSLTTPEGPNLYVLSPLSIPMYGSERGRRLNAALVRAQVRFAMARIGMRTPHVVVTIPTAVDVVQRLPRRALVVNRSDRYSAFPESDNELMRSFEVRLLGEADYAVYVNRLLLADEEPLVGGVAHYLGHGVDFDKFAAADAQDAPDDIAELPRPRIGFFGGLDDYIVDFDLLGQVADALPDAHLVLIGDATCPIDSLTDRANVTWLGYRDYAQIPGYGAAFDVALMPWVQNDWILHCNPIKAKEYLALGLPVVSMHYPEVAALEHVINVAHDPAEFVELVKRVAAGDELTDAATRRDAVRGDSWRGRAEELLDLADRVQAR